MAHRSARTSAVTATSSWPASTSGCAFRRSPRCPSTPADVARSADWLAAALRDHGFPTVEIWPTGGGAGLPSVFAEWPSEDSGAPTVLVYGHHDVQPVDPLELWTTPPFEPTLDGDVLRGRGSSDDKGQVAFHLLGLRAHLAASGRAAPAVNLKVLVEGEEESGSTNFPALLTAQRDRLRCDVVVVSDTTMYARDHPVDRDRDARPGRLHRARGRP